MRLLSTIIGLALVIPSLNAAPALKPEKKHEVKLGGTTWQGETAEGWAMTLEFRPDGTMVVSYKGMSFDRASWKQEGDKLYYEMNSKYCEFNGKITGNIIEGQTHNRANKVWTTRLTPVSKK